MSVGIEALFTSALGLHAPWSVQDVALDTSRRRIDFNLPAACRARTAPLWIRVCMTVLPVNGGT
jgi:hypothetical protein